MLTVNSAFHADLLPITTMQLPGFLLIYGNAAVATSRTPNTLVSN